MTALKPLPPDIVKWIGNDFGQIGSSIVDWIEKDGPELSPHVVRCVLFLAQGDETRFQQWLKVARTDPRDVFLNAEFDPTSQQRIRDFSRPLDDSLSVRHLETKTVITLNRVFNYCHELRYTDAEGTIKLIVEDAPCSNELLIWDADIETHVERKKKIIAAIEKFCTDRHQPYRIVQSRKRTP